MKMTSNCFILIVIVLALHKNVNAIGGDILKKNVTHTDAMASDHLLDITILDNIGQVALKMVQNIAAAEDEQVDMKAVSEFVIALSKATSMMLHPQIPQMEAIKAEVNSVKEDARKEKEVLNEKMVKLEQKLLLTEERNMILEERLNDSVSNIIKLKDLSNEKKIGFTACSSNNQQLQSGAILKFENVQINQGNNYDPSLSVFTCPLTGLYVVSVTITAYASNSINAHVLVDGSQKLHFYSYGSSHHKYNAVSESGLVRCNAGSKFWVQSNGSGQLYGGMYTMFTGYLYETIE